MLYGLVDVNDYKMCTSCWCSHARKKNKRREIEGWKEKEIGKEKWWKVRDCAMDKGIKRFGK